MGCPKSRLGTHVGCPKPKAHHNFTSHIWHPCSGMQNEVKIRGGGMKAKSTLQVCQAMDCLQW